jgi:two-component system, LytTR family, sensor kinase
MNNRISNIAGLLSSRLARNVYFWAMLLYTRTEFSYTLAQAGYTAVLFLLLALLFYTNNLLLIPAYLSHKKYMAYLSRYIPLTIVISAAYISVIKWALHRQPQFHPGSISPLVLGGETGSFSISAFVTEWWPYSICIFIVGCIFAMSWYVTDYQRQQKLIEQTQKQHAQMELSFLKNQINPHFLFNSLNNLYALTVKKSGDAPEVVSRIASILRYLLYESDAGLVTFEKEKEIMQAYIALELIRMKNTADMRFSITADRDYSLPPLLWLPVLENVFKHGTRYIADYYPIDYSFSIKEDLLTIVSSNNFKKDNDPPSTPARGIGLPNLTQRLNLLYDGRFTMSAKNEEDRYTIIIKINLKDA